MSDSAIEVDHVWKKFHRGAFHDSLRDLLPAIAKGLLGRRHQHNQLARDDFWALRDVSFQLWRGEALGVIGPNGAGKSTLLKVLSRILRPNRGHIRVHGRISALIEVSAGFHPDLTGRENVYLNGSILGMKKRDIDHKLEEIVSFAGLESFIDTPIKRYSLGMQARLGFSIMAHMNPEILLVDEVLSVGDAAFKAKCIQHMTNLVHASNTTIIFISHNLDQIRQLCNSCLVLEQGGIRFAGDVEQACQEYFECLRNQDEHMRSNLEIDTLDSAGRLLGLTVFDEKGRPFFQVSSYSPIVLEISYALNQDIEHIGLVVNFHKADGSYLANCNTIHDRIKLPSTPGIHKVHLNIEGLPFYGGDYMIGLRLIDVVSGRTIALHDRRYPLFINSSEYTEQTVYLKHDWRYDIAEES